MTISSAQGYQHSLTDSDTLSGLPAGSYAVAAMPVLGGDDRFGPAPESQTVTVIPGGSVAASVAYVPVTGKLEIATAGTPPGSASAWSVTGPSGYSHSGQGPDTLVGLVPGTYLIHGASLVANGDRYDAHPDSQSVVVGAGLTPQSAGLNWVLATGRFAVVVGGLPDGATAAVHLTGPGGYSHTSQGSELLAGLEPGEYTVAASPVLAPGGGYGPTPVTTRMTVLAAPDPVVAEVNYVLLTGTLQIAISGLPPEGAAAVTVTGPEGYVAQVNGSTTLVGLVPGTYTLAAAGVLNGGTPYVGTPATQNAAVSASPDPATASVTYAPAPGGIALGISGLPGGVSAAVVVTGPGGYQHQLTVPETLTGLVAGNYTVSAGNVSIAGSIFTSSPSLQVVTVSGGATAAAQVTYTLTPGSLAVTVAGLPGGLAAAVTVTGPTGNHQTLTASQTLTGLTPGTYTVTAAAVISGGTTYTPAPGSQSVTVTSGATAPANVTYTPSGGGGGGAPTFDLRVDGAYLTQATQRYDGTVPLVAGRNAYLRVFALANQANTAQPQVRVRLYSGAVLAQTWTLSAPAASVPTAADESSLSKSWNVQVPGALVQPGLRMLVDVDPAAGIPESDESNNQFPVSGVAGAVDVRALPTFSVRFVPVLQQVNGAQGNVTPALTESFLADLKGRLPVGNYTADVRAVYTTTAPVLQSGDGNGAWGTILSEVLALKAADASARYYYGVVHATYGSGIAGMGYVGGSARTAIGWDVLPSGSSVMAHEVGHNMGRPHAPCGGAGGPDPSYPYAGGQIGVWGLDVASLALKPPSLADLMGYCHPDWISDYNWSLMVSYRQGGPDSAPGSDNADGGAGLLVWGRIGAGGIVLEPAFVVASGARLPAPGPLRLDLLDTGDGVLRSIPFAPEEVADGLGGAEQHFAFVLPLDAALSGRLAGFRVRAGIRQAARLAAAGGDPEPQLVRPNPAQVDLRWNDGRYPMAMVRDAATGRILSFARGGSARIWSAGGRFEVVFSDGVHSTPARVLIPR